MYDRCGWHLFRDNTLALNSTNKTFMAYGEHEKNILCLKNSILMI